MSETTSDRHGYDGWGDGQAFCLCGSTFPSVDAFSTHVDAMTSVPPTQPPAAPETDVNGLTEAEREVLNVAVDEAETCLCCGDNYGASHVYAAVERIVAERVRVVEGERDALKQQVLDEWATLVGRMTAAEARAESAEAAHRALVEAIKKAEPTWPRGMYGCPDDMFSRRDLRALLAGGAR